MTKRQSVNQLRKHLAELFDSRHKGTTDVLYAKTQGYVDGYIQAMGDAGVLDNSDLLNIVSEERMLAAERAEKEFTVFHPGSSNSAVSTFA